MATKSKTPDNVVNSLFDGMGVPNLKETAPPTDRPEQTAPAEITQAPPESRNGRRNNNSARLDIRIPQEMKEALQRVAYREHTDAAVIVRQLIKEYLKKSGQY